jgi:hypothetical protein
MAFHDALIGLAPGLMTKQSVTVRVEPELVGRFREEAPIPLGKAVNEALRGLRQRLLGEQTLVSASERDDWSGLSDG